MKTLTSLCTPRPSVFDPQKRDTVLDLTDLVESTIDPREFFEENYITEGMKTLLEQTFRRLEGQSDQGVFMLKQAMGGGKTHNLLVLGLLARHPEFRDQVVGSFYRPDPALGPVKVVAFNGRETDYPYGIWGALAEQMGKRDVFKDHYQPLKAPGRKAWENLFANETVLILLDELPPYFQNARAIPIGDSNLAEVTATALSNLLIAIGRPACQRVALVMTDLASSYEKGREQIADVLRDFERETHRSAMAIEPVRLNSDEIYHILQKRIFETLPDEDEIGLVAQGYADALRKARQMDITNESPEEFAAAVMASYPFHPGIRDLYARFRENPGFQQTRGLIRLMRIVTARLWESGRAKGKYLIAAHDLDLNDAETRTEVSQINNSLENAIAHDIASEGQAVAEKIDAELGNNDATDTAKLLLMASLANVPNAILGLAIPELIAYLAEPGRDMARLKGDVLEKLAMLAWYLHSDRDGRLFFRNVQNLNAKLETLVRAFVREQAVKELQERLEDMFAPKRRWCYQRVQVLPAIDEIELEQDRVTLVISEPAAGHSGLKPELRAFYEDATWKNRIGILTGTRNTYDQLLEVGKRLRAIDQIVQELHEDRVSESDPQMIQAHELADRIRQTFHSAVRETFTTLWYPMAPGLMNADFFMEFQGNHYDGEEQIIDLLEKKRKFTTDISGDNFRKKVERRLFTQQVMPWSEIKRRAAMMPGWQWHKPEALDALKEECIRKDIWREEPGGYVNKGPFPQPATSVSIREVSRDDDTGEVKLRVTPIHGDIIYWDVGKDVSTASARLEGNELTTRELRLSFLCVDSSGVHKTGEPVIWENRITLKYKIYQRGEDKIMKLQAAPPATIHYTTDGSNPKLAGALYEDDFVIPRGTQIVLTYAERDGIESEVLRIPIDWKKDESVRVDPHLPARLERPIKLGSTKETYEWLASVQKYGGQLNGVVITIGADGRVMEWVQLSIAEEKSIAPQQLEEVLKVLRGIQSEGEIQLEASAIQFPTGQDLLDWVAEVEETLQPEEVRQ